MDFSKFKEKLSTFKSTSVKFYNDTLDKTAKKLADSSFTIKTLFDLEDFIGKSKNYFSEASGKEEGKKIICIFAIKESEFFKNFLYELPVIYTKAWARNIGIKIVDSTIEGLELTRYGIKQLPSLVLFENEKVSKVIETEEKINKIIKGLTLDIEESIKKMDQTPKVDDVPNKQNNDVITVNKPIINDSINQVDKIVNQEIVTTDTNQTGIISDLDIIKEIPKN
ncbi:hypothetical protein EOM39_02930 [Candidatus Gracilibacteria bacterium]|nr:hypothetical protein [Candidatus Gracilibacteria bacterium]